MANTLTRAYLGRIGQIVSGDAGAALRAFAAYPQDADAADALSHIPEYIVATRTTCVATMIEGGHAENALPQRAAATVNCRLFPGVSIESVRSTLTTVVANPGIRVELANSLPTSPVSEPRPDVMAAIARVVHRAHPGVAITPYLEAGGTDGLVYRRAGIPTWGSSGIFIRPEEIFTHGRDERIPVASFYGALDHVYELAVSLGGGGR